MVPNNDSATDVWVSITHFMLSKRNVHISLQCVATLHLVGTCEMRKGVKKNGVEKIELRLTSPFIHDF